MLLIQSNIAQSFQSPLVRVLLAAIGLALLYVFYREVRKIPAKLFTLMITAFVDMLGLLMIIPLLPFYVKTLGGEGIKVLGMHLGVGSISGIIVAAFTVAQLASAPMWGRFSDRVGRRPTLLIAIGAAGIAYLIFGFATSLWLLFLSRIVQGAGGGTVGVIQAYVADSTAPEDRARALLQSTSPDALLVQASKDGDYDLIKWALAFGADIHFEDDRALYFAVLGEHERCVQLLMNRGANPAAGGIVATALRNGNRKILDSFSRMERTGKR